MIFDADDQTYWRIDHRGWELARSHRSVRIDGEGVEAGTSCCYSRGDLDTYLQCAGYDAPVGDVNLVEFRGDLVGYGYDDEPIVLPRQEVARWGHRDWTPAKGLWDPGWHEIATLPVQ